LLFLFPWCAHAQSADQPVQAASSAKTAEPNADEPKAWFYSDAKFIKAYDEAKALHRGKPEDFLSVWKHADKAAKGECIECQRQIIRWQAQMGAFHDVEKTAGQMLALAQKPQDKFFAESELGQAYLRENFDEPKPEQLHQAEAHLHAALVLAPKAKNVLFLEGRALAMEERDAEAREMFQRYAELTDASDRYHARAERFVETPHLAALRMAPPFHMVTAQGEEMNLDDMHGKVVLLDFWATWCGPCKETLPEVASIAKEFRNEPLVVISISWDADASAWQQFVQKNHMDWPQYRDADSALRRVYGVTAIPHFFTIDADGVLQAEQVGSNADIRAKLKKLVKQARTMQAQAQVADAGTQH
jgi:thiol-disulfide isomerase/thioredoxin